MKREDEILAFWFEGVDEKGLPSPGCFERWFLGGDELDVMVRDRFASDVEAALNGDRASWADSMPGFVALVLLLDQFPRHIYRGDARAFAGDAQALQLVTEVVESGEDASYRPIERYFLYLPFEHAEDAGAQKRAIKLYQELVPFAPAGAEAFFVDAIEWARRHQVVIDRFGRFPSRNAALSRESTKEEKSFLAENPSGF